MKTDYVSAKDLEDFINTLFDFQKCGHFVFRGYCCEDELKPSLVRDYDARGFDDKIYGIRKYERFLLNQYSKYSLQYLPPFFSPLDFVASAQHFGLPTRLIDWTFDPFCALYFAAFMNSNPEDGYYKLTMVDLNKNMYFDEVPIFSASILDREYRITNNELINDYLFLVNSLLSYEAFFRIQHDEMSLNFCNKLRNYIEDENIKGERKLFFCSIYDSNTRIIAQRGLFQIPRRFIDDVTKDDITSKDIKQASTILYMIDKSLRTDILSILHRLNISTPRLFPDLQNICSYLKKVEPSLID